MKFMMLVCNIGANSYVIALRFI